MPKKAADMKVSPRRSIKSEFIYFSSKNDGTN